MKPASKWILAGATLLLIQSGVAREHWGPPQACPPPKVDCCPKPKCETPCKPVKKQPCQKKPCEKKQECCPKPCEPCCPPVCFERGLPTTKCCTPSAFSESAAIETRCGSDVFVDANFIYWQVSQDGMDLAIPGQATALSLLSGVQSSALGNKVLFQDFDYEPGFQVGLGWGGAKDNWTLYAEYTWLHANTHTSASAPTPDVASINGVTVGSAGIYVPTNWFPYQTANNPTTHVSSKWKYGIDLFDLQISRPYYSGTRFTVDPSLGLRGAIFTQSLKITLDNLSASGATAVGANRNASYRSHSWAIGPRLGMKGSWHLGYGLRIIGDGDVSLLYTRFTKVSQSVDAPSSTTLPSKMKMTGYGVIRPNADLSLGLGWGSYLNCRRFYFDLAATYDFSIFWDQNMIRYLADLSVPAATNTSHTGAAPGSLFTQGLTVKTRFEF